jgi:uncharacterized membrane protein
MNPTKINRNSWHYKLLEEFHGANSVEYAESLCDYTRLCVIAFLVTFLVLGLTLVIAVIALILAWFMLVGTGNLIGWFMVVVLSPYSFGYFTQHIPLTPLYQAVAIVDAGLLILYLWNIFSFEEIRNHMKSKKEEPYRKKYSEPGIVSLMWDSWKNKICVPIEFEGGDKDNSEHEGY